MMTVYQIARKQRRYRGQIQDLIVKSKDVSTITYENAKLERWREHFEQLLNRCDLPTHADISEADQDLDIKLGPITIQEVKDAVKKLKNSKAPGDDNSCVKFLGSNCTWVMLYKLFTQQVISAYNLSMSHEA